ncbi:transporter substrate-binding domain-containing protein [Desulfovibrio ferrophilus]|uniref:Family 3 extracellular solute-binding protein n=1 Tax=Desulfovibrio ferrophilus TaxID=241368 RepID=A0A2Z6AWF3_9BACT|nr:transporter substrate-binding domain-containing protein [Desulfovibrio ferrophilus]BBD07525.1 family 3 extracellular solute-binding protein [Desulfovibrio ferrophilus]
MNIARKLMLAAFFVAVLASQAFTADFELAKKSTLETIMQRGELRIGTDPGYPPFEMTDKKGNVVGFDIDLAKEMAKAMGVKLNIVSTDYDGIIPALRADKFDIVASGMTLTQERNLQINFADPYIVVGQAIILNKKHEGKIKSYKDLNDPKYTVASRLGTTGEIATKRMISKAIYKSFDKEADGALDVVNGQADAFVYDLPFLVVFMAQQGGKNVVLLDKPFTYEPLAWGIKKGDPDFLNFLNNFMKQIKADGRYDRIYNKWIKSTGWIKNTQ